MAEGMWAAFRQEANGRSRPRPWLGWVMLLEDRTESGSYVRRHEQILHKFTHERLFDAAALLASPEKGGARGAIIEADEDLSMRWILASLLGWIGGYMAEVNLGRSRTARDFGSGLRDRLSEIQKAHAVASAEEIAGPGGTCGGRKWGSHRLKMGSRSPRAGLRS